MELKEVIHYYLGCQMQTPIGIAQFIGSENMDAVYTWEIKHGRKVWSYKEVKPILRRLEDMTEVEAIECAKLTEWEPHFTDVKAERTKYGDWVVSWQGANESRDTMNVTGGYFYCAEQFIYLLKNGFDLFELIPTSQAINATTLTSKNVNNG